MELLQKLTLYDLLGYTVPGSIMVVIVGYQYFLNILTSYDDSAIFLFSMILVMSYICGIMISEIMRFLITLAFKEEKMWVKICKKYNVSFESIGRALYSAKMIDSTDSITSYAATTNYLKRMYGDIQADSKYNRIHNYASAELLYKNMIFVATICIGIGCVQSWKVLAGMGAVGVLCFCARWKRFYDKKMGYLLCWFVEKYNNT